LHLVFSFSLLNWLSSDIPNYLSFLYFQIIY
jgi:hypothetical protein